MRPRSKLSRSLEIWPGFVDALTSLLMVMVFVLMVFALEQAVLSESLGGKSRALAELSARIRELSDQLVLSHEQVRLKASEAERLVFQIATSDHELETLKTQQEGADIQRMRLNQDVAELLVLKRQLETKVELIAAESERIRLALKTQATGQVAENEQSDLLNLQLSLAQEQVARLAAKLAAAKQLQSARDLKLSGLRRELDTALLAKANSLERYRSDFFGRLREALGNRNDVLAVGDRFVVPTDILFSSGSAELEPAAIPSLTGLASTLRELSGRIPKSIDWVLRIDGHTDQIPIRTERYPSNWELSTARAVAIVKNLIEQGIPAERLSANGFGEYRPLDPGSGSESLARNRRIELQLTNR